MYINNTVLHGRMYKLIKEYLSELSEPCTTYNKAAVVTRTCIRIVKSNISHVLIALMILAFY